MSRRTAFLLLAICVTARIAAQDPYGAGTPGSGGFVPALSSNQAWMGNAGFALSLSNGLGGAGAVIAISAHPASSLAGGTQILVSLASADLVFLANVTLGGAPGVAGAGSAMLPIPLTFPVDPALAGTSYYAQAGVGDFAAPGTFAASAGLRITLTMPPLVAVTKSYYGPPLMTETSFVDPLTMTAAYPSHVTGSDVSTGMAFAHGGRDLYVSRSTGNRIDRVDFSGGTPAWSVFHGSFGNCYGVAVDEARDLVYTLVGYQYLIAVDALGQQVGGASVPFSSAVWGLSRSGNLATIVSGACPLIALTVIDTNPASGTYLQPIAYSPIPSQYCGGSLMPQPARVVFSRDDQWVFIQTWGGFSQYVCSIAQAGISRYHVPTGTWTDFNFGPYSIWPGTQPVGGQSAPPVTFPMSARDLVTTADGSVTWSFGFGWVARIAYDLVAPGVFTPVQTGSSAFCSGTALGALTPDQSVLIGAESDYQALIIARIDPVTLAVQASFGSTPGGVLEALAVR